MNWTEISITTTTEGIEDVTGIVLMQGVGGVVVEDKEDFKEFLKQTTPQWDYVDESLMSLAEAPTKIKCYLPESPEGAEQLALIREALERVKGDPRLGTLEVELHGVKEEDWANNWKQFFKPLEIDERLVVKPSWEQYDNKQGRTVVQIDPKMSFGTGTHHTTRLCLQQLSRLVNGGEKVLDLGCGSGILSIAALLLGAKQAVAVDIDPLAAKTARENAVENGVTDRLTVFPGNVLAQPHLVEPYGPFDLVVANIVADVIIEAAPLMKRVVKPSGWIITSGIIDDRAEEVRLRLAQSGLNPVEIRSDGGWFCIVCRP